MLITALHAIWWFAKITAPFAFVATLLIRVFLGRVGPFRDRASLWNHHPLSHAALFFGLGSLFMWFGHSFDAYQVLGFIFVLVAYTDWYCQFVYNGRAARHPDAYRTR